MKKIVLIMILIATSYVAFAFDNYIPAQEMFGKYFKFSTYYNKEYQEFEDGFDNFGVMIAKPQIYGNFGLELDAVNKMDDVYRETFGNLSIGFNFRKRFAFALTGGFVNRAYDTSGLIFNEEETIADESIFKPTVGASFHSAIIKDKLEFGGVGYYLNQPDVSMNSGEDKLPFMIDSFIKWDINKNFELGATYHLEDNEHYIGLDFTFAFPAPWFKVKTSVSQEKVSVMPSFHTFNYLTFDVKYDYFLEEDLVGTNYGVQVTYELVKEYPVIAVYNEFEGVEVVDSEIDSVEVDFGVEDAERLYFIKANLNEETKLLAGKLNEYSKKDFTIPLKLKEGKNVFDISTRAVNGEPITKKIVFNYEIPKWITDEDTVKADTVIVVEATEPPVEESIEETVIEKEPEEKIALVDTYVVKPGDSLWKIASLPQTYNNPHRWKQIYELNRDKISNPDLIYPNQVLTIRRLFNGLYQVKKGDTLWDIAKRKDIYDNPLMWKRIYELNKEKISNPNLIYPDQRFRIWED